jgi:hypothetical protein
MFPWFRTLSVTTTIVMPTATDIALLTLITFVFFIWLVAMIYMRFFTQTPPLLKVNPIPHPSRFGRESSIVFEDIELQLRTPPPTISPDII